MEHRTGNEDITCCGIIKLDCTPLSLQRHLNLDFRTPIALSTLFRVFCDSCYISPVKYWCTMQKAPSYTFRRHTLNLLLAKPCERMACCSNTLPAVPLQRGGGVWQCEQGGKGVKNMQNCAESFMDGPLSEVSIRF